MDASRLIVEVAVATSAIGALAWLLGLTASRSAVTRNSVWRAALLAFWLVPAATITAHALHLQICPAFMVGSAAPMDSPAVGPIQALGSGAVRASLRGLAQLDTSLSPESILQDPVCPDGFEDARTCAWGRSSIILSYVPALSPNTP